MTRRPLSRFSSPEALRGRPRRACLAGAGRSASPGAMEGAQGPGWGNVESIPKSPNINRRKTVVVRGPLP
jgi:hypothetical protein